MPSWVNRQWILARRPKGRIDLEDFVWRETTAPTPGPGQMLLRNLVLSLDPTLILFANGDAGPASTPVGGPMRSLAACQVVESRVPGFQPGDVVETFSGWEDYSLSDGKPPSSGDLPPFVLPKGVPTELAVGVYGYTGMAAYFGMMDVGRPKAGETCVVTSAAGGVGTVAGQIAQLHGCRVIGVVSGKDRAEWLQHETGFAAVIDRRQEDVGARLQALAPEGIDIFFENTGSAELIDVGLQQLRDHARVVLCGATALYLMDQLPAGPQHLINLIMKQARMEGIYAARSFDRFAEARAAMEPWIRTGRLRPLQDVLAGLEQAPRALERVFGGANRGKQLVRIADAAVG